LYHVIEGYLYEQFGSGEIPDLTSLPEIHDEPVFEGYRKGGCSPLGRDGGHEKIPKVSALCYSMRRYQRYLRCAAVAGAM
jgi:hypothetical protein